MKLLVVALVLSVVLFLAGLIAPRRSRRLQARVDRLARRGERKAGGSDAGRTRDLTRKSLKKVRKGSDKSAQAGRDVRKKISGDS
jgi:uncharacterized membrane protein